MDHAVKEGFVFKEHRDALFVDSNPNTLLDAMAGYEHSSDAVKKMDAGGMNEHNLS